MKKIFTLLSAVLLFAGLSSKAQDAIYPAFTLPDEEWAASYDGQYFVNPPMEVESYDGYVIIKAWAGAEGYDLKVAYDEEENVTGVSLITDGVEGTVYKSGYTEYFKTGLKGSDVFTSGCVYLGDGYDYCAGGDEGYVFLSVYFAKADQSTSWMLYEVNWFESREQIESAAADDLYKLDDTLWAIAPYLDEEVPCSEEVFEAAEMVFDQILDYAALVEEAEEWALGSTGVYESPITDEVIANIENLNKQFIAFVKYSDAIDEWQALYEKFNELQNSETYAGFAVAYEDEFAKVSKLLQDLSMSIEKGLEMAEETGEYAGPSVDDFDAVSAAISDLEDLKEDAFIELLMPIEEDYELLEDLYLPLSPYLEDEIECSDEVYFAAGDIAGKIFSLMEEVRAAEQKAIDVTGVYVSPLTDTVIAEIKAEVEEFLNMAGINGIINDAAAEVYYDLNGKIVANPAAGKVYIRVAGGKATKVVK